MSLYDPDDPKHLGYLDQWRSFWTPEREAEVQEAIREEKAKRERLTDRRA